MEEKQRSSGGMKIFTVIWVGQFISLLGSGLTGFGLPLWVYAQTGRATDLTTMGALYIGFLLLASPFAGVLVDRSNRKLMMMLSDLAAVLVTIVVLVLFATDNLQTWHLFITSAVSGAFQSFQWPAFSSAVSVMVDKRHYTRASTMMDLANTASAIFAPILAAALLGFYGENLRGFLLLIFSIDLITFFAAIITLLFVNIPQPEVTEEQKKATEGGFWSELMFGFKYIFKRPSLVGLQSVFMIGNFFLSISGALMVPMILARTGSNGQILGVVQAIAAAGGIIGGIVISAWGGFKNRVHGVLGGWAVGGLFVALIGLGRGEPPWLAILVWGGAMFLESSLVPLINGSNQGIWQAKVSPDIQGKVFSVRRLIAWVINPVATAAAGPLADFVLEPAMQSGGGLLDSFSWLVGSGPGAGMSLTYVITGLLATLVGLGGYLVPAIRDAEKLLPDHGMDAGSAAQSESAEPAAEVPEA